ncbi:MAG: hypothetical protein HC840_10265 [Leptolyngbyaceae cyanobacterium RM2_2_4]|nr:hypothetical protein [Leptolyngbyaceae cyanobacterium RM2_2_4]
MPIRSTLTSAFSPILSKRQPAVRIPWFLEFFGRSPKTPSLSCGNDHTTYQKAERVGTATETQVPQARNTATHPDADLLGTARGFPATS